MEYKCSNDAYKVFICYRRKETDSSFAASEDVAGMLHWWLNYDTVLKQYGPALFEECYPATGTLTFCENGIEEFMPQMTTCFVVLCQDFFYRALKTYHKVLRNYRSLTNQEQLDKTRDLLSGTEKDICYLELKHALKSKNTRVCPIWVKNGNQGFYSDLDNDDVEDLQSILGEGSEILFSKINTQTIDYADIAPQMQNFSWSKTDATTAENLMQSIEEDAAGRALLQYLKDFFAVKKPAGKQIGDSQNRIRRDLKLCAKTVSDHQLPKRDKTLFCAGNPKLIYDPVRMHHDPTVKPPFLATCLVDSFSNNKAALGLQTDTFRYWNVDMDSNAHDQEKTIGLSVCAVCFGTLCTYHRLYKDSILLEEGQISERMSRPFLDTIHSGINLLLALRNPYTKTWPSSWVFNEIIGVEGTTNQTTLSLSTLMSCGFLSPDTPGINASYLKARYRYIWESVEVLLEWGESACAYGGAECKGWHYTARSSNAPALLPTVFVFDVLCKLQQNISKLIVYFQPEDSAFCQQLREDASRINNELTQIIEFFRNEQRTEENGVAGAFKRYADTEYSMTHTAYVIKSLYQYAYAQNQEQRLKEVEGILEPATAYLVEAVEKMVKKGEMHFEDWERFENFCDSDPDDDGSNPLKSTYGERYEHCAELIIAEALIKIAEHTQDKQICDKAMELLHWMFNTYSSECVNQKHDTIYIKSARPKELLYPIYYLYYYRMFLWDYLSLLKKKEG